MPKISETTRRWKNKVDELEARLERMKHIAQGNTHENIELKAKLERFQLKEGAMHRDMVSEARDLQDQVSWLRDIVEHLVIPDGAIKARVTKEIRLQEARNRQAKINRKEWERERSVQAQMDCLKKKVKAE